MKKFVMLTASVLALSLTATQLARADDAELIKNAEVGSTSGRRSGCFGPCSASRWHNQSLARKQERLLVHAK